MILQTVASITAALTLVSASAPRGPSPTFENDPDITYEKVVENFRQANQLLLVVEENAQQLSPEQAGRVEPVLALLEEQLDEAAHQLAAADDVEQFGLRKASVNKSHRTVSPEVYEGINSDIITATHDLESLSGAMSTDDYL